MLAANATAGAGNATVSAVKDANKTSNATKAGNATNQLAPRKLDLEDINDKLHWKTNWPEGIVDNSGRDEDVLNIPPPKKEDEKEKNKKIKYLNVRPAVEGQWPYK